MSVDERNHVEYLTLETRKDRPFCSAARVGNMLYVSGQMGTDDHSKLVPGGLEAETRQAMENMKTVLEQFGSSLNHVVKVTVMLADIGEWAVMNAIYLPYFPNHLPARSAFGANGLARGARVEIECIAVLK